MADDPLDKIAGRLARIGKAPVVPGIPVAKLPPRPGRQTTFPELPSALPKRPEQTYVGAAGPPAAGSGPSPRDVAPHSTTLESNDAQPVQRERPPERQAPRSVSPAPWDPRASSPELRRETERMGDRLVPAPESKPSRSPSPAPFSTRDAIDEKGLSVRWSTLKKWAPWLLAFLGLGGGGGTGYFVGLKKARAEIADLQAAAEEHEKRLAKRERAAATLSKSVDLIDESLKSEAQERRGDVGKLRDDVKKLKEGMPTIEGLRPGPR